MTQILTSYLYVLACTEECTPKKKKNQLLLRIQISSLVLEKLHLEIQSHLFGKVNVETVLCFHSTVFVYGFFFPFTTV